MTTADSPTGRRLTPRGAKTRAKIVATAADLMYIKGVGATTLDDVIAASAVSKSQLYHHFTGKDALVRAVIDHTGERIIERERNSLDHVSTIAGLRRWRDALVRNNALRHGAYGCALGSLASEVADHDEVARQALSDLFTAWRDRLSLCCADFKTRAPCKRMRRSMTSQPASWGHSRAATCWPRPPETSHRWRRRLTWPLRISRA